MRTLKIILLATLAFAFSVATAQASTVDVIWTVSGTSHTTVVSTSAVLTGNIVMSVGATDTAVGGFGGGYELSLAYTSPGVADAGSTAALLPGFVTLPQGVDNGAGLWENFNVGASFGGMLAPGATASLGTVTVHVSTAGPGTYSVAVGNFGTFGDDITNMGVSIIGEWTFNAGTISHIPEPTTASLLGLGLIGLTLAGRRR